ncbi:MAG: S8 family serine peptidase [Longimicrobiales bacterium]|nr:S8 family serine peptidase [Longimicrobiales bacterium]
MPRYVLSHRLAGSVSLDDRRRSADALREALVTSIPSVSHIVSRHEPEDELGRHLAIVEAEHEDMEPLRRVLHPGVLVEPEVLHRPPPQHAALTGASDGEPGAGTVPFRISVLGDDAPLPAATAALVLEGAAPLQGVSGPDGVVSLPVPAGVRPSLAMIAPAAGFWSRMVSDPRAPLVVRCRALPSARDSLGWWHQFLGVDAFDPEAGAGIRVGVLDSGLAPHPALHHVESIGSFLQGRPDLAGGADVGFHGTYACGILTGRPRRGEEFGGFAPGSRVYAARIFNQDMAASQADIALALHALAVDCRVDLINLSFSADTISTVLHDAILHALAQGALCICSAGNVSLAAGEPTRDVTWPARYPETVAVGAVGRRGWAPADSGSAHREPDPVHEADQFGDDGIFLGNLSCRGEGLDCVAPGVGIISTVPPSVEGGPAPYDAMDGTSASSPAVCGALARHLSGCPDYRALPRNASRAARARSELERACRSLGLTRAFQGAGAPRWR